MMALRSSVRDAGLVGTTITGARRELGEQLATLRGAAGHKQTELAGLTGYSRSGIANAEVGRQPMPREFWVRADDLLGGQGALVESHDKITLALGRLRGQGARETAGEREIRYGARLRPSLLRQLRDQAELPAGGEGIEDLADGAGRPTSCRWPILGCCGTARPATSREAARMEQQVWSPRR